LWAILRANFWVLQANFSILTSKSHFFWFFLCFGPKTSLEIWNFGQKTANLGQKTSDLGFLQGIGLILQGCPLSACRVKGVPCDFFGFCKFLGSPGWGLGVWVGFGILRFGVWACD
jgi:hypothetical protein